MDEPLPVKGLIDQQSNDPFSKTVAGSVAWPDSQDYVDQSTVLVRQASIDVTPQRVVPN